MQLVLKRVDITDHGIFGHMTCESFQCVTLERHDVCIPPGIYRITLYNSPEHGLVPLVNGVPGRTMIEIHEGNWEHNSKGCILVGQTRTIIEGQDGISNSQTTKKALVNQIKSAGSNDVTLVIQ